MIWSLLLHPICIYSSSKKSWWELLIHDWDVWADSIHFQVFFSTSQKSARNVCVYLFACFEKLDILWGKETRLKKKIFQNCLKRRLDVILFLSAIHCLNHVRHSSIFKAFYKKKDLVHVQCLAVTLSCNYFVALQNGNISLARQ